MSISQVKAIRTALVTMGIATAYLSLLIPNDILFTAVFSAGLGLIVWGCYVWARLKGRHWAWMLFGLLAPIGLLALALLHDKN